MCVFDYHVTKHEQKIPLVVKAKASMAVTLDQLEGTERSNVFWGTEVDSSDCFSSFWSLGKVRAVREVAVPIGLREERLNGKLSLDKSVCNLFSAWLKVGVNRGANGVKSGVISWLD